MKEHHPHLHTDDAAAVCTEGGGALGLTVWGGGLTGGGGGGLGLTVGRGVGGSNCHEHSSQKLR